MLKVFYEMVLSGGSSHRNLIDSNRRQPDADRNGLAFFSAGPDARIQLQIVTHHGHVLENVGPTPDERRPFDRFRDLSILDEIGFTRRERRTCRS